MAETTKKTRTRKSVTKSATASAVADSFSEEKTVPKKVRSAPKRQKKIDFPADESIYCVSGIAGENSKLTYQSKRLQGCSFEWNAFGEGQYLEFAELQTMRNATPAFFENNWILIDDDEALQALHADRFYPHVRSIEDFYEVLEYDAAQIREVVPTMGSGLKRSLAYVARERVASGELDSNSVIKAIEETTGYVIGG